ncbi:MAG TPA: S41 family peptidase [Geobacteraceae bacterium]|nr:S41 family peptidase [Geobacteraceae bacterium]
MLKRKLTMKNAFIWVPAALAATALVLFLDYRLFSAFVPSRKVPANAEYDFGLMTEAWNTIHKVYVDRSALKNRTLTYGAISGMVDALGDTGHSVFLTPDMLREQRKFTEGRYKGVGVEITVLDGRVVIVTTLDGSPARAAGLRSGELITMVGGRVITGLPLTQVVNLISGPEGTRVRLTVFDPATKASRLVTLTRSPISVRNVRWSRLPGSGIAHLRIAGFSEGVSRDLRKTLMEIRRQGIDRIILDLRDDPGGVLEEAVDCTSQFLKGGNALLVRDAAGDISPVPVTAGGEATGIPLAVLVNEGTASGAEIMAGAIQDYRRGKLIGTRTFGAGTVLGKFDLSDGSALMLAVDEWLTPGGHAIWHKGITPDVDKDLDQGVFPLFPEQENGLTETGLRDSRDIQLLAAIRLLSGREK